jgi:Amt family ammonium transporter
MKRFIALTILLLFIFNFSAFAEEKIQTGASPAAAMEQAIPAQPQPKLDAGDTAWMIMAAALVMLMTLPGLALFYGSMAKRKDALNSMAMSFAAYCIVSFIWVIYGYSLAFGNDWRGIIGSLDKMFLSGVTTASLSGTVPEMVFIVFQLTFAAITVALVSGSFIERMKFSAWVLFTVLWVTIVYIPVAHWVWGNGFLAKLGALDFAGGTVVHINAGFAGLVGALILGKRHEAVLIPNNLTLTVIGAGLLWFGWFGFNAGSALAANGIAGAAFLNTNTAAAIAAVAWMFTEWIHHKKPTVLGLASGAVAGLVAITPAAGFVNISGAIIIGLLAGIIPYLAVAVLKPKLGYDDALDAFGIHGIAGLLGAILTGFFADPSINEAGKGLFYGNPGQLLTQTIAVVVTIVYASIATLIIFMIIKAITGVRVDAEEEVNGLDESQHGEKAYNL